MIQDDRIRYRREQLIQDDRDNLGNERYEFDIEEAFEELETESSGGVIWWNRKE